MGSPVPYPWTVVAVASAVCLTACGGGQIGEEFERGAHVIEATPLPSMEQQVTPPPEGCAPALVEATLRDFFAEVSHSGRQPSPISSQPPVTEQNRGGDPVRQFFGSEEAPFTWLTLNHRGVAGIPAIEARSRRDHRSGLSARSAPLNLSRWARSHPCCYCVTLTSDHRIVRLESQDAPALQQLYEQCQEYMVLVTGVGPAPDEAQRLLRALPPGISIEQKIVLGLRAEDDELLGAADVIQNFPRDGTWYIGEFILSPKVRRSGLGRALFRAVEERAMAAGASHIDLAAHEGNVDALAFWARMGFGEIGLKQYRVKDVEGTFVLMHLVLPARRT